MNDEKSAGVKIFSYKRKYRGKLNVPGKKGVNGWGLHPTVKKRVMEVRIDYVSTHLIGIEIA